MEWEFQLDNFRSG